MNLQKQMKFVCKILQNTNIFLNITQSVKDKRVRVEALKTLGIEMMLHLRTAFLDENGKPWIMIIPSYHQCVPIVDRCLSGMMAIVLLCGVRIHYSHGISMFALSKAVLQHALDRRMSHPEIAPRRPPPSCSICGEIRHTARSRRHTKSTALTLEQFQIDSYYY